MSRWRADRCECRLCRRLSDRTPRHRPYRLWRRHGLRAGLVCPCLRATWPCYFFPPIDLPPLGIIFGAIADLTSLLERPSAPPPDLPNALPLLPFAMMPPLL